MLKPQYKMTAFCVLLGGIFVGSVGCTFYNDSRSIRENCAKRVVVLPFINCSNVTETCLPSSAGLKSGNRVELSQYLSEQLFQALQEGVWKGAYKFHPFAHNQEECISFAAITSLLPVDADYAVIGRLIRFQERKGGDYAVSDSASVALTIRMVSCKTGRLVYQYDYDEKQRSLFENLLKIKTFWERNGKWVKAVDLAEYGIRKGVRMLECPKLPIKKDVY